MIDVIDVIQKKNKKIWRCDWRDWHNYVIQKKTEKIRRCDWRDWRDYVIQKKKLKKYDAVIGVIDVIMWFRRKNCAYLVISETNVVIFAFVYVNEIFWEAILQRRNC